MATLVTDPFNRANEAPLASPWAAPTGLNSFNLTSNELVLASFGTSTAMYRSDITPPDDQWAQSVISNPGNGNGGPAVRMATDANTMYCFICVFDNLWISKIVAGSFEVIEASTGAASFTAGDVARLEVQGTTLRAYLNGALLITTTDGDIDSGRFGLTGFEIDGLDSFEAGDFLSAGGSTPRNMLLLGVG